MFWKVILERFGWWGRVVDFSNKYLCKISFFRKTDMLRQNPLLCKYSDFLFIMLEYYSD